MRRTEIILSIILMVISITIFILTYQFPQQTVALPPTAFPRFVSLSLWVLSLILFLQGVKEIKKTSLEKVPKLSKLNKTFIVKLVVMIFLAYFYTLLIRIVGYVYATPPFIAGNMLLFNEKRSTLVIITSLLVTILLYILFKMVFKVPLPRFSLF